MTPNEFNELMSTVDAELDFSSIPGARASVAVLRQVEAIQDMVETVIVCHHCPETALRIIRTRIEHLRESLDASETIKQLRSLADEGLAKVIPLRRSL